MAVVGDGCLRDAVRRLAESLGHSVSLLFKVPEGEAAYIGAERVLSSTLYCRGV